MASIPTVRGPIDSSELGVTLMHEHLFFQAGEKHRQKSFEYQVELARRAVEVGVNTMVDCGPYPEIERIVALSEKTPELNLILSTGAYLEGHTPEDVKRLDEDGMVERMGRHIALGYEGFEKTGIKAGVIKVAGSRSRRTEWEKKNFRAAARAQREFRVPIVTHACAGAREQMELLGSCGAYIPATFYSHIEAKFGWDGRTVDQQAEYLRDVAEAGGYLQFNNFDFEFDTPFGEMMFLIDYLEEHGCGEKIFISIDCNFSMDDDGRVWHEAQKEHPETGKRTHAYAITHAIPMMMASGVSLQRINKYFMENPRRYFEAFDGPKSGGAKRRTPRGAKEKKSRGIRRKR